MATNGSDKEILQARKQSADIIIHLQNLNEILRTSDTPAYRRRILNKDIEELIVEKAASFPRRSKIDLIIYLPTNEPDLKSKLETAFHKHFTYRREKSQRQLKHTLKLGCRSLFIAFLFLGVIISLIEFAGPLFPANGIVRTIRESLIILGWVAFWRPAELLLYEWYPFKCDAELYGRLSESNIQVVASEDPVGNNIT
jgi:hypothetical protein